MQNVLSGFGWSATGRRTCSDATARTTYAEIQKRSGSSIPRADGEVQLRAPPRAIRPLGGRRAHARPWRARAQPEARPPDDRHALPHDRVDSPQTPDRRTGARHPPSICTDPAPRCTHENSRLPAIGSYLPSTRRSPASAASWYSPPLGSKRQYSAIP